MAYAGVMRWPAVVILLSSILVACGPDKGGGETGSSGASSSSGASTGASTGSDASTGPVVTTGSGACSELGCGECDGGCVFFRTGVPDRCDPCPGRQSGKYCGPEIGWDSGARDEELVKFLPVLAYDGSNMTQVDAGGILDINSGNGVVNAVDGSFLQLTAGNTNTATPFQFASISAGPTGGVVRFASSIRPDTRTM